MYLKLTRKELLAVKELKDPLCELFLINGWRRGEATQAIINFEFGNDFVMFKPKKHKKAIRALLTKKEIEILTFLKKLYTSPKTSKIRSRDGIYKSIGRHFKELSKQVHFDFTPHRLRATHATLLARRAVNDSMIQKSMNHKNFKTTQIYIQPDEEDILDIKESIEDLNTIEGMTIQELYQLVIKQRARIKRLEDEKVNNGLS